jgi:hypothetical protein
LHVGAEPPASVGEAIADPLGSRTRRESRVAELELERDGLQPQRAVAVELDEEQQAEVVAQLAVDRVVVEEVAEVVQDPVLDAVEDVCRMAGDERRAGRAEASGGAPASTRLAVSTGDAAQNGWRPVSASQSTTPTPQTSAAPVASWPASRSGAM